MRALLRLTIILATVATAHAGIPAIALAQTFVDQFPLHKQTKYFDFYWKRNSSSVLQMVQFSDAFVKTVNASFFKADFEYPIRVFVLEDQARLNEFIRRELHMQARSDFGVYVHSLKLLATYENSGLGTFTHEVLHPLVEKNLRGTPPWALEGIPTFFEKFYGYWKGDELVLLWGFQNPWRIKELGVDLVKLDLQDIIAGKERDESKLRMVSLFLWQQGSFKRFLRLTAANDKSGYASYFEAAMQRPIDKIIPLWQKYLNEVAQHRAAILSLPPSTLLDSKAAFDNFAKLHSISKVQVWQRH